MTETEIKECFETYCEIAKKYKYLDIEQLVSDFRKIRTENQQLKIENAILKEKLLEIDNA